MDGYREGQDTNEEEREMRDMESAESGSREMGIGNTGEEDMESTKSGAEKTGTEQKQDCVQGQRQEQEVLRMGLNTGDDGRRWRSTKRTKKFIWGVLFLLGAVALVLGKLGYLTGLEESLGGLKFWPVCFSVILLGCLIDGITRRSFGIILFSLAFLIIVNDKLLHLEALTPWTVLGVAVLGTIGLNFIFPKRRRCSKSWKLYHMDRSRAGGPEGTDNVLSGEKVHYDISFGSAVKYISGQGVSKVSLESSFGDLGVYFNGAALKDHQATVYVECSFGNMELFVPSDWKVVLNISNSFGGVEESGHCNPAGENVLYVGGEVSFGHLQVTYI